MCCYCNISGFKAICFHSEIFVFVAFDARENMQFMSGEEFQQKFVF